MTLLDKLLQYFADYNPKITNRTESLTHLEIQAAHGPVSFVVLNPYLGVTIVYITADLPGDAIPMFNVPGTLTTTYCLSGSFSSETSDGLVTHFAENTFIVNLHPQSKYQFKFNGPVKLISVVYDLEILTYNYPQTFRELNIPILPFAQEVEDNNYHLAFYGDNLCQQKIESLATELGESEMTLPWIRFYLLQYMIFAQNHIDRERKIEPVRPSRHSQNIVQQAEYILTRDLSKRCQIPDIAKELGVSPATLKRCFTAVHGKSLSVYMQETRIRQAKNYLMKSDRSIEEISRAVGYENQSKFSQFFRKMTGQTPTEYRKSKKINH